MYTGPPVGSNASNQPQHQQAHYANQNNMVSPSAYYPPPQSPQQQQQQPPQHTEQYNQPQKVISVLLERFTRRVSLDFFSCFSMISIQFG